MTASQNAGKSPLRRGAAFGRAQERQALLQHTRSDRMRDRPLHGHGRAHGAEHWTERHPHAQPIERREMGDRDREGGQDRQGENTVGHRDIGERDHRHPDDVEQRNDDADAVGAEPVEPAEAIFALLLARQALGPGQKVPPVLAHELQAAERPTVPLPLVGFERVRQQPVAVAVIGVVREPATLEDGEAEIGVLDDGIARPAPGALDRRRGASGTSCRA